MTMPLGEVISAAILPTFQKQKQIYFSSTHPKLLKQTLVSLQQFLGKCSQPRRPSVVGKSAHTDIKIKRIHVFNCCE